MKLTLLKQIGIYVNITWNPMYLKCVVLQDGGDHIYRGASFLYKALLRSASQQRVERVVQHLYC